MANLELGLLALLAGLALNDDSIYVECPCGVKLDRVGLRQGASVNCDGCGRTLSSDERFYHCPRGRTLLHTSGFDLCDSCAQKSSEAQAKKDELNAPKLPDPLKFVRCRCTAKMDFIPVRIKYRSSCKCDECGSDVPRLGYLYHCPKERMDEHRTNHRLFDYCFSCAYKKNPTLANDGNSPSTVQLIIAGPSLADNSVTEEIGDDSGDSSSQTVEILQKKLQQRALQIKALQDELTTLRSSSNVSQDEKSGESDGNRSKVLDAILQSNLPNVGLPGDREAASDRVNEITLELIKLNTRQAAALEWLSNGDMGDNDKGTASVGVWSCVSSSALQSLYSRLDSMFKQYDEMSSQVTTMRATCLEHISKKQDDWENWSSDEVVDWISAIEDGRFLKYATELRRVLKERSFKGKHLKTLKFDRLAALGIKDYEDADALMGSIEILVKGNST